MKRKGGPHKPALNLDAVVCMLSQRDSLRVSQLYEGLMILGATGSGKTSGPMRAVINGLLKAGAGGVFLTAKPDDAANYKAMCIAAGREKDFIDWCPGSGHTCDVLDFELQQPGSSVDGAAQLIDAILRIANRHAPQGGGENVFWDMSAQRLIRMAITVIYLAHGHCSLSDIHRLLVSAPQTSGQAADKQRDVATYCGQCHVKAAQRAKTAEQKRDLAAAVEYWYSEWPNLADKTRSIIQSVVQNITSKFVTGPVASAISSGTTNTPPDLVQKGKKLICLNYPVLVWRELGQWFQIMLKILVTRSVLRRNIDESPLPVFIAADECQLFTSDQDMMNQTVSRSQKLISIAATQSIPVFVAALGGGEQARNDVLGLIANHQVKFFGQTTCAETAKFASEMFGYERKLFCSTSMQSEPYDMVSDLLGFDTSRASTSMSEQWHPRIPPQALTTLRKGGAINDYIVQVYAFLGGRLFSNGKSFMKVEFDQRAK